MDNKYIGKCIQTSFCCTEKNSQLLEKKKNDSFESLDLNIDNYSLDDVYKLFSINTLNDDTMKQSKRIVLKTHPDKSNLDQKYFLFFSQAYKRLYGVYEFQNKSFAKQKDIYTDDITNTENGKVLNNMIQNNKSLKDPDKFNDWFNKQFEKHKIEDSNNNGYGDWLKSDEGIYDVGIISKSNMAQEFEKQKKQIQSIVVYNGVNDVYSSSIGGTLLAQQDNYTSEGGSYTDLRQAYIESVIPVTEEDYKNMPKYRNVEEYKNNRNNADTKPLDKEAAMKKLFEQNKKEEQDSAAVAYYYAQQTEKANKQNNSFWAGLKQLTHS